MTHVQRDGADFVIPATLLASAMELTEEQVRSAMREGTLTSICEIGVGSDTGRWRLTFRHANRACRYTVDAAGTILSTSRFPVRARPTPVRE